MQFVKLTSEALSDLRSSTRIDEIAGDKPHKGVSHEDQQRIRGCRGGGTHFLLLGGRRFHGGIRIGNQSSVDGRLGKLRGRDAKLLSACDRPSQRLVCAQ